METRKKSRACPIFSPTKLNEIDFLTSDIYTDKMSPLSPGT